MENKNPQITIWTIISVTTVILCSVTFILSLSLSKKVNKLQAESEEMELKVAKISEISSEVTENTDVAFVLKNHNGVIGVFDQFGVLTDIINVDIKSLPERDRSMLEAGIWARSRQELASLIEDYTG